MAILINQYLECPEVDVFANTLRHGSVFDGKLFVSSIPEFEVFHPSWNALYLTGSIIPHLEEIIGLDIKPATAVVHNTPEPTEYPKKWDKFVTHDYLSKKIWRKTKRIRSEQAYWCLQTRERELWELDGVNELVELPFTPTNQPTQIRTVKWCPASLAIYPLMGYDDQGITISRELFDLFAPKLDPPFWWVHDLDSCTQLLP